MSSNDISPRPNKAPIQVACVGLGRTGTSSMMVALEMLGFGPVHHMKVIVKGRGKDVPLWRNIHEGVNTIENLDKALAGYRSVTDYPGAMYVQELYDAYPDTKYVLTVRDPEKWKKSVTSTIYGAAPLMRRVSWWMPTMWRTSHWSDETIWDATGYHKGRFREDGAQQFVEHTERCKRIIPADQLLVYEVGKDRWEPLCDHLGVPIPEEPFPHVNDSAQFNRMMSRFRALAITLEIGVPSMVAIAAYFVYKRIYK